MKEEGKGELEKFKFRFHLSWPINSLHWHFWWATVFSDQREDQIGTVLKSGMAKHATDTVIPAAVSGAVGEKCLLYL